MERLETLTTACTDRRLQRLSLAVLGEIATCLNRGAGRAWPSQQYIADRVGMLRPHVNRACRELEACGYIVRNQEPLHPGGRPLTMYRLVHVTTPPEAEPVTSGGTPPEVVTSDGTGGVPQMVHPPVSQVVHRNPESINPEIEPGEQPSAAATAPPPKVPPQRPRTLIPEDWSLPEEGIVAAMERGVLTREQVFHEVESFVAFHRERRTSSAVWGHNWRTWIDQVKPGGRLRWRIEAPSREVQRPPVRTSNVGMLAHELEAYVQTHPNGGWT